MTWIAGCGSSSPGSMQKGDGGPAEDAAMNDAGSDSAGRDGGGMDARVSDAGMDAGSDAPADARPMDASSDTGTMGFDAGVDGAMDGGMEASSGGGTLLLEAVTNLGAGRNYLFDLPSGSWKFQSGFGGSGTGLGGITFLASGDAVEAYSVTGSFGDVSFGSGLFGLSTWSSVPFDTSFTGTPFGLGAPAPTPTGAAAGVGYQNQVVPPSGIGTANYVVYADYAPGAWGTDLAFPATVTSQMDPVVVMTGAGEPLVLLSSGSSYMWMTRSSGVWTSPVAVPGVTVATSFGTLTQPVVNAARAVGSNQILAVFWTGTYPAMTLVASTFSMGAWSSPVGFAADAYAYPSPESSSIVALPDGSIAFGYTSGSGTTASAVRVGFWNGTSWGVFQNAAEPLPFSLAAGVGAAKLELVNGNGGDLWHTRLLDVATWTWTIPTEVDSFELLTSFALASTP